MGRLYDRHNYLRNVGDDHCALRNMFPLILIRLRGGMDNTYMRRKRRIKRI